MAKPEIKNACGKIIGAAGKRCGVSVFLNSHDLGDPS